MTSRISLSRLGKIPEAADPISPNMPFPSISKNPRFKIVRSPTKDFLPKDLTVSPSLDKNEPAQTQDLLFQWPITYSNAIKAPVAKILPQLVLDENTIGSIDRLVDYRNKSCRPSVPKSAQEDDESFKEPPVKPKKKKDVIKSVEGRIRAKGIHPDKGYDSKFQIFEKIPTFVNARDLLRESAVSKAVLSYRNNPSDIGSSPMGSSIFDQIDAPSNSMRNTMRSGNFSITLNAVSSSHTALRWDSRSSTKRGYETSTSRQKNKLHGQEQARIVMADTRQKFASSWGGNSEAQNLAVQKATKKKSLSPEQKKSEEIRQLYLELKRSAIKKFGVGIFENAHEKLRNPETLRRIQKKRVQDSMKLKDAQFELMDLEPVDQLIKHLQNKDSKLVDLQNENQNAFHQYLDKELVNDRHGQFLRSSSMPVKTGWPYDHKDKSLAQHEESIGVKKRTENIFTEEEDMQMKILQEEKEYKEKSERIVQTLKNVIKKTQRNYNEERESFRPRNTAMNISRSFIVSRGSQRNSHLSRNHSISHREDDDDNDQGSPTTISPSARLMNAFRNEHKLPGSPGKKKVLKTSRFGNSLMPPELPVIPKEFIRPFDGDVPVTNKSSKPFRRSISEKFGLPERLSGVKTLQRPDSISPRIVIRVNRAEKKKESELIQVKEMMVYDLQRKLNDLSNMNKELTKGLKVSMKQAEDSYKKQANAMNSIEIPDSLLSPIHKPLSLQRKATSKITNSMI